MRKDLKDLNLRYRNDQRSLLFSISKLNKNVSYGLEETQRKLKYNEELAREIAATEANITSIIIEESRIAEERKKVVKKNMELNVKLKRETSRIKDLQLSVDKKLTRMEEQAKVVKDIHDRVNLLLKPYHDILGLTFQLSKQPEVSLRILFEMPTGKKCVVKLSQNGLKIVKCVPMLKELDKVEERLAKTNDYSGFVTHLRSLFMRCSK